MRQCAYRIVNYDSTVIENLLEFRRGGPALMRGEVREPPHVHGVECSEEPVDAAARRAQLIPRSALQQRESLRRLAPVQREKRANFRHICETHGCVAAETPFKIVGQSFRAPGIVRQGQRESGAVLYFAIPRAGERSSAFCVAAAPLPESASQTAAPIS